MNFDLTEEQKGIQKATDEFAKGEFDKEVILDLERNHQFPFAYLKKACQLGFIGIHYPEAYGGQGYGILENALIVEAFCFSATFRVTDAGTILSFSPAMIRTGQVTFDSSTLAAPFESKSQNPISNAALPVEKMPDEGV